MVKTSSDSLKSNPFTPDERGLERLYLEAQRRLQVMDLLHEAAKVINSSLDIREIMHSLLAKMNDLLHVEAISIALVDRQTNELVYEVAEGVGSDKIVGLRLPSNQGVSGWVMEHAEPALVTDTRRDPRFDSHGDERTGYQTRAIICAPLVAKDRVLGTIQAINPIEGPFLENDLQMLVSLANLASSAIANAQQFRRTQEAEARYLGLFEDSIDPIILTDVEGRIVEANRRACEFLGYGRRELMAMHIGDLHLSGNGSPEQWLFLPRQEDEVRVFTSRILPLSKKPIPVEVHTKRIATGGQELLQWIHHDVSEQLELQALREDLTAMLLHDLQNPLGNIIASLELIGYEIDTSQNEHLNTMLEIARRSSDRLRFLIRSLLDISRLEAGETISERKAVYLPRLVAEAEEFVRPSLLRRRLTLQVNLEPETPTVYGDEDMIRRVLTNLLDNAIKFSEDGRMITLDATQGAEDGYLLVAVSDQGPGIAEEYRKLVFDKFQRLPGKDTRKGMGLGLAFCRLVVEAHGGRIWVTEADGGGAKFNFTLPTTPL